MFRRILLLAGNTFREAVRNKIFYTLLFFAILLAGFSVSLSTMIIGSYTRVIIDMGLAIIEIFGTLIAIFVGITLVHKEIDKRTVHAILARPIHRYEFVFGKFIGLWLTLFVEVFLMTLVLGGIVAIFGEAAEIPWMLKGICMILVQLSLITSVAVLFSSVSTPILSGMFTIGFYLIGAISSYLPYLVDKDTPPWLADFITYIGYILPNFDILNYKGAVIHHAEMGFTSYFYSTVYGLSYTLIILTFAVAGFKYRDLK